jgi:hypothetical protein
MSAPKDGGPAFPVVASNGLGHVADGMSLRDWFAGMALASLAHPQDVGNPDSSSVYAYKIPDAMLAEREKGGA